ncbi:MAG: aspartyl protease family protein, partial [Candidatus Thermoplasmatota archaeon]
MAKRVGMGEVHAQVVVKGPKGAKRMRLLVDTGSTFTWIRASRLRELGIRPLEEYPFDTVQGQDVTRPVGEGRVEYQGDTRTTVVVFARPGDGQVLGLHALEGLALEVDPVHR